MFSRPFSSVLGTLFFSRFLTPHASFLIKNGLKSQKKVPNEAILVFVFAAIFLKIRFEVNQ